MRKIQLILSLIPPTLFITIGPYIAVVMGAKLGIRDFSLLLARPVGILLFAAGLTLSTWCAWLLSSRGEGTPSPFIPPKKLVVAGPYLHVRNPMLLGIFSILAGEALYLGSTVITFYLAGAVLLSHVYIVFIEEKELEDRFGKAYTDYMSKTPRWIPMPRRGSKA